MRQFLCSFVKYFDKTLGDYPLVLYPYRKISEMLHCSSVLIGYDWPSCIGGIRWTLPEGKNLVIVCWRFLFGPSTSPKLTLPPWPRQSVSSGDETYLVSVYWQTCWSKSWFLSRVTLMLTPWLLRCYWITLKVTNIDPSSNYFHFLASAPTKSSNRFCDIWDFLAFGLVLSGLPWSS